MRHVGAYEHKLLISFDVDGKHSIRSSQLHCSSRFFFPARTRTVIPEAEEKKRQKQYQTDLRYSASTRCSIVDLPVTYIVIFFRSTARRAAGCGRPDRSHTLN